MALLTLAALVIAAPIVLVWLGGNPLPERIDLTELGEALRRPVDDVVILEVVTGLAWLLWGTVCVSVLVETLAYLRGRPAPRLPGLGVLQQACGQLVTSVTLLTGTPATAVAAIATPAPLTSTPQVTAADTTATQKPADVEAEADRVDTADQPSTDNPQQPTQQQPRTYTVQRGDTLWDIADEQLGDPRRWPRIAQDNADQIFDPDLIQPGWRLTLPSKAKPADPKPPAPPKPNQPPSNQPSAPPSTIPPPSAEPSPAPPVTPSASVTPLAPRQDHSAPASHSDSDSQSPLPSAAVFLSGMAAGGLLATLAQLRMRQRQHRRRGRRIRLPQHPRVQRTEQRLAYQADSTSGQKLRDALRALAARLHDADRTLPAIVGVHITTHGDLEILLAEPATDPPPPFTVVDGSRDLCWQLPATAWPTVSQESCDPLPGLVTAGRTQAGGLLLVDVEALGLVGVTGARGTVDMVLQTLITEATVNPWSGYFELIAVGFEELQAADARLHLCSDLNEALDLLAWRADAIRSHLANSPGPGGVRDRRLVEVNNDDLVFTLFLSDLPASPEQLRRLQAIIGDDGGIAAILPAADSDSDLPARFALTDDGQMRIDPLELTVDPRPLSRQDYSDILALLDVAADTSDVAADQAPYTSSYAASYAATAHTAHQPAPTQEPAASQAAAPATQPATDVHLAGPTEPDPPEHAEPNGHRPSPQLDSTSHQEPAQPPDAPALEADIQIHILGPLEIKGTEQELQPKQAEIVLLLALNEPHGLKNDQLRMLLGPDADHPKKPDSLRQAITRTRGKLGTTTDGQPRIQHVGDGVYRLADAALDWARFQSLVDEATASTPTNLALMRSALELIRGRPLQDCWHWWIDTPLLETMRATIVDAAELAAELELAADAPAAAGHAARKGLIADPAAEQLWRALMRAEHAAGRTAGVHEAWNGCLRQLAAVSDDIEPHPDTAALYRQLAGRLSSGGAPFTTPSRR